MLFADGTASAIDGMHLGSRHYPPCHMYPSNRGAAVRRATYHSFSHAFDVSPPTQIRSIPPVAFSSSCRYLVKNGRRRPFFFNTEPRPPQSTTPCTLCYPRAGDLALIFWHILWHDRCPRSRSRPLLRSATTTTLAPGIPRAWLSRSRCVCRFWIPYCSLLLRCFVAS